jgi:polyisoprenoid-binding protein YceI
MKKFLATGLFALGFAVAAFGVAEAKLSGSGGQVQFTATGPGGLTIVGTTKDVNVKDDGTSVTVVVPLANVDTGIALRNKHMKEKYLEVDKFPTAELTVSRSALKLQEGSGSASGSMKIQPQRDLQLHREKGRRWLCR